MELMKHTYTTPVAELLVLAENLAENDLNGSHPGSGLDNEPGNGGDNDGAHDPGAKGNFWDDDEVVPSTWED